MRIEVTEDHIRRGSPLDGNCCPIALALRERFPGCDVCADPDYIALEWVEFAPPPEASDFMRAFDNGREVRPFAFDIPDEVAP